jgi:hypothetical protein
MRRTPKEIAASNNPDEIREWILTANDPREIQGLFHTISIHTHGAEYELAKTAIAILNAESAERSSQRIERQTETLIALTRRLCVFTVVLVVFALFDVVDIVLKLIEHFSHSH